MQTVQPPMQGVAVEGGGSPRREGRAPTDQSSQSVIDELVRDAQGARISTSWDCHTDGQINGGYACLILNSESGAGLRGRWLHPSEMTSDPAASGLDLGVAVIEAFVATLITAVEVAAPDE